MRAIQFIKNRLPGTVCIFSMFFLSACDGGEKPVNVAALSLLLGAGQNNQESTACPPSSISEEYLLANTIVAAPDEDDSNPFKNPNKSINGVCGGGQFSGSLDVYTLGNSSPNNYLTLSWNGKAVQNGVGIDFIVFENGFRQASSVNYFIEPVIVEVSRDNSTYCGFHPDYIGLSSPVSLDPSDWLNFGGLTPVLWNMGTNRLTTAQIFSIPATENSGGDAFDLEDIYVDGTCTSSHKLDILNQGFLYIRLTNAQGTFPTPAGSFDGGPDIDGVLARTVSP